jgi:PIN domain nuclease of toxin-antitoxin system
MVAEPRKLSVEARALLTDPENQLLFSAASAWEIGIKYALGKLSLPAPPSRYVPHQIDRTRVTPLSVEISHALDAADLHLHHRDPFDRLLIAQARLEGGTLMTSDPRFDPYGIDLVFAG